MEYIQSLLTFLGIQGRKDHYMWECHENVRITILGWMNHWSSSVSCLWQCLIANAWRKNKNKIKVKDARDVLSSYAFLNPSNPLRAPVQEVPDPLFMTC